jgi:hypothetical protein
VKKKRYKKEKEKEKENEQGKNKEGLEMKNEDYMEGEPLKKVRRKKKPPSSVKVVN